MHKYPIQIVIADDNRFFADALKDSLNLSEKIEVRDVLYSINSLLDYHNYKTIDILILAINFNGQNSLDILKNVLAKNENLKVIALTTLNNNFIKETARNKGVNYFVGKDTDLSKFENTIMECYLDSNLVSRKIGAKFKIDNYVFTKRKLEFLQSLYKYANMNEKELSEVLHISESTIKTHKRELFEITNTKNTTELIKFGISKGLILP